MSIQLIVILFYVILQLGIGYLVSRTIKSEDDYFLAGRRNGVLLISFSAFATWFGAETCIGSSGAIYTSGLAGGRADPFGYALCLFFFGIFLARKMWDKQITTLGDLYRDRYSPSIEVLAATIIIPSSLFWAAAQVRALGQIISSTSGSIDLNLAIALSALVVILYTTMGGLLADALTDILQGGILIIGLITVTAAVFFQLEAPLELLKQIPTERLNPFDITGHFMHQIDRWSIPILGSLVAQELISRVSAAKSAKVARRGAITASAIYLCMGGIPVILGLIGPMIMPNLEESEQLLPLLAQNYLPPLFSVIFSGALVSAILSTIDSALLAAGALFSHNLVPKFYPKVSDKKKVLIARSSVAGSGLIAFFLAINADRIYDLVETASSIGSSGILVITIMGLFTKIGNKWSAMAALLSGLFSLVIGRWTQLTAPFIVSVTIAFISYFLVYFTLKLYRHFSK